MSEIHPSLYPTFLVIQTTFVPRKNTMTPTLAGRPSKKVRPLAGSISYWLRKFGLEDKRQKAEVLSLHQRLIRVFDWYEHMWKQLIRCNRSQRFNGN